MSFVERSNILCHYLRGSTIRGFTELVTSWNQLSGKIQDQSTILQRYKTHQIYTLVHKHYSNYVFISGLGEINRQREASKDRAGKRCNPSTDPWLSILNSTIILRS